MTLYNEICNAFNNHAEEYDNVSLVQREIGTRLFERLQYLRIEPRYILDVGCGPGHFTKYLQIRYPKAHVVGIDIAYQMLCEARLKQSWRRKWSLINGNMCQLPFAAGVFDLVFANQVIHWAPTLKDVFKELHRVMHSNGCLMFSTLGPATFQELRQAWATVHTYAHTNEFIDMHDVGDQLVAASFTDPVVDMEILKAKYKNIEHLLHSLKSQGVRNVNKARNPGLTGKRSWQAFGQAIANLHSDQERLSLTYEVVYGHAWKGTQTYDAARKETHVTVDMLYKTRQRPVKGE